MRTSKRQNVFDRRSPENVYLSILLDQAMTYKRILGQEPASNFLREQQVPSGVARRILDDGAARRADQGGAGASADADRG